MRKKQRKPRWSVILVLFLLFSCALIFGVLKWTEDGTWTVWLGTDEQVGEYHHFLFAKQEMMRYGETEAVCVKNEQGQVAAIRYGIVNFNTKDAGTNTLYQTGDGEGFLNGASTGAGLYVDSDGTRVKFQVAGVTGWADLADVELGFWYPTTPVPTYMVQEGKLIHTVSNAYGRNSYAIGDAPDFLSAGKTWYSFDGHWFYDSFYDLSSDVCKGTHEQAVNEQAWYNPWQFVSHRTKSALTNVDYDRFLFQTKGVYAYASAWPCESWQSVLFSQGTAFNDVQDQVWMNAAMMYAAACNESGYGQSQFAVENHNVFGHSAFDESPDSASSYPDIASCVYAHAMNFLQKAYCNPENEHWHGSWFGDKASGINVDYASDPYWGEKAASFLYQLGWIPENTISGTASRNLQVYSKPGGNLLYEFKKGEDYSFVAAGESENGWTPVWSEAPIQDGEINADAAYTEACIVYVRL